MKWLFDWIILIVHFHFYFLHSQSISLIHFKHWKGTESFMGLNNKYSFDEVYTHFVNMFKQRAPSHFISQTHTSFDDSSLSSSCWHSVVFFFYFILKNHYGWHNIWEWNGGERERMMTCYWKWNIWFYSERIIFFSNCINIK